MMHKAWSSIEEVPYCFWRSSVKFQGHTGWKIDDWNPIWVRLLGRSQLSNPSDLPWYNHVRREDKHLCYHVRCWPSCTLFGQISILSCTLLSVMYVAMSNEIRLKSAPLLLFFLLFFMFSQRSKGPLQCSENVKKAARGSGLNRIKPNNYGYHVRFFW